MGTTTERPYEPRWYPDKDTGARYLRLETDVEFRSRCIAKWGYKQNDEFTTTLMRSCGKDLDEAAVVLHLTRMIVEDECG